MQLLKAYGGHRQSQYSLRACFGGFEEAFIVCGSEGTPWLRCDSLNEHINR